jgi:hypothetical protein
VSISPEKTEMSEASPEAALGQGPRIVQAVRKELLDSRGRQNGRKWIVLYTYR